MISRPGILDLVSVDLWVTKTGPERRGWFPPSWYRHDGMLQLEEAIRDQLDEGRGAQTDEERGARVL